MLRPRVSVVAAISLGAALALSACGDDQPQPLPAAPSAAPTSAATASAPADAGATPGGQATNPNGGYWPASISVADTTRLGQVVVDGDGFTLYRFDNDSSHPPRSTCFDACAQKWPPVLTRNKIIFHGVDRSLLGAIERSDGTYQVTLAGHPMYRFSGDTGPGDLNGEAVGGTWFSFAPSGTKANGDN